MAFVTEYLVQQNAGTYTTIMSTEMNSLANGSTTLASVNTGGTFTNVYGGQLGGYPLTQIQLNLAAISTNRTANTGINVWFLQSLDNTNYETGTNNIPATRNPDVVFPSDGTSNAYSPVIVCALPPGHFKVLLQQNTGTAFASSGNTLNVSPFSDQAG